MQGSTKTKTCLQYALFYVNYTFSYGMNGVIRTKVVSMIRVKIVYMTGIQSSVLSVMYGLYERMICMKVLFVVKRKI